MNLHDILLPVFAQVALMFALLMVMGGRRLGAVRAGEVSAAEVSMGQRSWPAAAQRASNAFSNQFEVPLLFFALVPLAILTRKADTLFVVLSWVFVISRFVHAGVYVVANFVPARFVAYLVGVAALLVMWVAFVVRILSIPLPA